MIDNEPKLFSKETRILNENKDFKFVPRYKGDIIETIKTYDDGTVTVENSENPGVVTTRRPPKITEIAKNVFFVE